MTASADSIPLIDSELSHYIIFGCSIFAILWGGLNALWVSQVELDAENIRPNTSEEDKEDPDFEDMPWDAEGCKQRMLEVNEFVKDGAITFLNKEYCYLSIFITFFAALVCCVVDVPWEVSETSVAFPFTMVAFIVGAFTSMMAGYIGMKIATVANVKTTYLCCTSDDEGFKVAYRGGQVLGFVLVGLALLILEVLILCYKPYIVGDGKSGDASAESNVVFLFEMISGYGLGGSTVALFGRVGGGIYTKAADVGADLAGKVGNNIPEDSHLNPGTIADNVGDNVGDIAGMGADLFGSLAESTCACLIVSATSANIISTPEAIYFPLIVTSAGIVASFITQFFAFVEGDPKAKLTWQLIISTVLMTASVWPCTWVLPDDLGITFAGETTSTTPMQAYGCIILGLWSGLLIGLSTEYFTSNEYAPTLELVEACRYDAAPNIIKGLALGYMSNVLPIFCLAITVLMSFSWAAMYGVALAAIGMLGCLPIALSVDGYGPVSDNAGGIAEMSNLDADIRKRTDYLDAAGNTTAAIGKGFAIGSACLVGLALFGAFVTRVAETLGDANVFNVNILEPFTFAGLLVGAMLPYWFSALTMSAVGDAAQDMIAEIMDQVPKIQSNNAAKKNEEEPPYPGYPNHEKCIAISTEASLKKMIYPGCLVIISPLLFGWLFGYQATNGILAGGIVSGIQIAFSASNSGGAWDNCKKYVEAGKMVRELKDENNNPTGETEIVMKKSKEHVAAVVGDTVGDPLKDTSGPSINILIKLSAICSLVFGSAIAKNGGLIAGGAN